MKVQTSLIPVLTLAAAFAFAQQPGTTSPGQGRATDQQAPANPSASQAPQPSQGDAAGQAGAADANSTTVRGCLGTGANNTYTVTEDKTGTVYTLAGKDFSSLSSHVGQEVEADGQPMPGNATGSTAERPPTRLRRAHHRIQRNAHEESGRQVHFAKAIFLLAQRFARADGSGHRNRGSANCAARCCKSGRERQHQHQRYEHFASDYDSRTGDSVYRHANHCSTDQPRNRK